ncbi:PAS domain-containing protein [Coniochaeta sp. 2T2.1]|nr:PAS domain-containing protein [Coniochaeta sp. 2T2.1]
MSRQINTARPRTSVKMNPFEEKALTYVDGVAGPVAHGFHPELYTASGIDALSILLKIYDRPNPQVNTGAIDTNCPLILCDLAREDCPIVYASGPFAQLTGYHPTEVLGQNCRFLQIPPTGVKVKRTAEDKAALKEIRHAVRNNLECQVQITNYRKDGSKFLNYLTIIPVQWNSTKFNYSVGLQNSIAEL